MSRRATTAVGALLSATVLASGSAAAQPAPDDAGVAATSDVVLNEIGAELGGQTTGGFVELRNNTDDPYSLHNHVINACDAAGDLETVVQFQLGEAIPANSTLLIADPDWNAPSGPFPNKFFEVGTDPLQRAAGGLELVNGITPVDDVKWGMMDNTDCAGFTDAGVTPDDDHSIQPNPSPPPAWCRAIPTPGAANGSCAL